MKKAMAMVAGVTVTACVLTACVNSSSSGSATSSSTTAIVTTSEDLTGKSFCDLSRIIREKYSAGGAFGQLSALSPADVQKFFTSFDADLRTWESAAPNEIRSAIAEQTKQISDLEALLAKYGYDFAKAAADNSSAPAVDTSPAVTNDAGLTANQQIAAFEQEQCGLGNDTLPATTAG